VRLERHHRRLEHVRKRRRRFGLQPFRPPHVLQPHDLQQTQVVRQSNAVGHSLSDDAARFYLRREQLNFCVLKFVFINSQ